LGLALATTGFGWLVGRVWPASGVTGAQMLVWGFFISTVVLLHATLCINSMAHTFGRRRYATDDESRNSLLLAIITLGEGWHNNHHFCMSATRQGFYWWEIDVTYYLLKGLSWLGIISDLHPVPARAYDAGPGGLDHQPAPTGQ
jgi:stearoyl-CoA desaturase (delta-9 desaturase)